MATCEQCGKRDLVALVVPGDTGPKTLLVDITVPTYRPADITQLFPTKDGEQGVLAAGVVPHDELCPSRWRQRLRRLDERRTAAKKAAATS